MEQRHLLVNTDHQSLSMSVAEFYEVLKSASGVIKPEPAASAYWQKRSDIEENLRLKREANTGLGCALLSRSRRGKRFPPT